MKTIVLVGYNTEYDKVNGAEANRKMREIAEKGDTPILAVECRSDMTNKKFDKVLEANRRLISTAQAIYVKIDEWADPAVLDAIGYAIHLGKEVILSKDNGARLTWPKSKQVQETVFDLMRAAQGESTITDATKK